MALIVTIIVTIVFPRRGFVGFRLNVISGFSKILSLPWPAGANLVLCLDFNDQKRLVLSVFEFHTISVFIPLFVYFCLVQN